MAVLSLIALKTKAAILGTAPPSLMEMGLTSTPDGMIYLFGGIGAFVIRTCCLINHDLHAIIFSIHPYEILSAHTRNLTFTLTSEC
jgi:hypothetical protein